MPVVSPSTRATIAAALRDRGPLRIVADRRLGRVRLAGTLAVRFTLLPMQFPPPQEHTAQTAHTHIPRNAGAASPGARTRRLRRRLCPGGGGNDAAVLVPRAVGP